jgi:hypothetical protein
VADTLDDTGSGPTGTLDEDSDFDENQEIINLEMSDFDRCRGDKI